MDENEIYELHCKGAFASMNKKLDRIEAAINGNGEAGMKIQVDRNRRWIKGVARVLWCVVTATVGMLAWIIKDLLSLPQ